jgi:hypothetical protein
LLGNFEGTFSLFFKDKKSKRSKKKYTFSLLMEGSGSGSVQIMTDPDGPKAYESYGYGSTSRSETGSDLFDKFFFFIFSL